MLSSLAAAPVPDFADAEAVARWRTHRLRGIVFGFTALCGLCAGAEYFVGDPRLAYLYGVNAVLLAAAARHLRYDNRMAVERSIVGVLFVTCLASVLLTGLLINLIYLLGLLFVTSIHEESPRRRRAWTAVYFAVFCGVGAYLLAGPEPDPATGRDAYLACVIPVACTLPMIACLLYEYTGIGRRIYARNAELNEELAARLEHARVTESELREKLAARRRVTRSIAQSVEGALLTRASLEASHEQLAQFAYAASHDLKEPVRTIKSFMRMAQRKMPREATADAQLAEQFAFIQSNATAMHEVLDRLLVYSRATRVGACAKTCELRRAWQLALVQAGLPDESLRAQLAALESVPAVELKTDPAKLQLVLAEFVSNAVRFCAPGAEPAFSIEIDAPTDARVTTRITDRGIGFDPAYAEQVFGLFHRLHPREQYPSAGVGLAIVRQLGKQLGLTVALRSEVGAGTTAELSIPLRLPHPTNPATPAASA